MLWCRVSSPSSEVALDSLVGATFKSNAGYGQNRFSLFPSAVLPRFFYGEQ